MINLLRSEVLKIRSTQVWIWMLVLAIGLTTLFTLGSVLSISDGDTPDYYSIFTVSGSAGIAMLVLGVLGLTTEFRHKTITPTLLATPNRWQLLIGKALSYVVLAVPYGLICIVTNIVVAIICLDAKNLPVELGNGVPAGIVKAFVSLVFLAFFGLGLGALVRNQAAGMVVGIAYIFVINPLLASIPWIRKAYPFEFGGGLDSFNARTPGSSDIPDDIHQYSSVVGLIVLLVWCFGMLALGGIVSLKRDIS